MRGFFVSLAAVLFVGIMIITLITSQQSEEEQTRIELEYLQNRLAVQYLDVAMEATIPRAVASASKEEFRTNNPAGSPSALRAAIQGSVEDAVNDEPMALDVPFESYVFTLTGIDSVTQPDNWTIEIDYTYRIEAESRPGVLWEIDGSDALNISVVGLTYPGYAVDQVGFITPEFWEVNTSNDECYLEALNGWPGACASDAYALCPLTGCNQP